MSAVGELREIALGALTVDPAEFSARQLEPSSFLIGELRKVVREGFPLDAIDVWRSGRRLFVVDGFARLAAYRAEGVETVPVRVHEGPRTVALQLAVERNAKLCEPLSPQERTDFAWRVVRLVEPARAAAEAAERPLTGDEAALAALTKPAVARMHGISERTVAIMRSVWAERDAQELARCGPDMLDLPALPKLTGSWSKDRRAIMGRAEPSQAELDKFREQRLAQLAFRHRGLFTVARKDRELVVEMLQRVLGPAMAASVGAELVGGGTED